MKRVSAWVEPALPCRVKRPGRRGRHGVARRGLAAAAASRSREPGVDGHRAADLVQQVRPDVAALVHLADHPDLLLDRCPAAPGAPARARWWWRSAWSPPPPAPRGASARAPAARPGARRRSRRRATSSSADRAGDHEPRVAAEAGSGQLQAAAGAGAPPRGAPAALGAGGEIDLDQRTIRSLRRRGGGRGPPAASASGPAPRPGNGAARPGATAQPLQRVDHLHAHCSRAAIASAEPRNPRAAPGRGTRAERPAAAARRRPRKATARSIAHRQLVGCAPARNARELAAPARPAPAARPRPPPRRGRACGAGPRAGGASRSGTSRVTTGTPSCMHEDGRDLVPDVDQPHHPAAQRLRVVVLEGVVQREGVHVHHRGAHAGVLQQHHPLLHQLPLGGHQQHVHLQPLRLRVQDLEVELHALHVEGDVLLGLPADHLPRVVLRPSGPSGSS